MASMINNKRISGPIPGGVFANRLGADIMVGARPAASPLFAAVSLAGDLPFAFVREAGYVGHALSPAASWVCCGSATRELPCRRQLGRRPDRGVSAPARRRSH